MKIAVISDIHAKNNLIEQAKADLTNADLVLYCGDFVSGIGNHDENKVLDFLLHYNTRYIRGNLDDFESNDSLYLSVPQEINGITFIPYEGILTTPFGTLRERSEKDIAADLTAFEDVSNAVIVAHQPPYGACDIIPNGVHVGSKAIRTWIEQNQPRAWLCGHIHEANGEDKIGETLIINGAEKCRFLNL